MSGYYARKLTQTCFEEDFTRLCVYCVPFTEDELHGFSHHAQRVIIMEPVMQKIKPYMTDEEVIVALRSYDDLGYDDLPGWLKKELQARNIPVPKRSPSELERWETNFDALEHRITNKELTIDDYLKYYQGKRNITDVF